MTPPTGYLFPNHKIYKRRDWSMGAFKNGTILIYKAQSLGR